MKFVDPRTDAWRAAGGDDGVPPPASPVPHLVLTLAQWHAVRGTWPPALPTGVVLPNDADVEALDDDVPRFALIALQFPLWTDGRAYSQARLLRRRLRYGGELRATGQVLVDMLPLLHRTGFDAVQLRADQSLDSAQRALRFFCGHYQGDAHEPRPRFRRDAAPATSLPAR